MTPLVMFTAPDYPLIRLRNRDAVWTFFRQTVTAPQQELYSALAVEREAPFTRAPTEPDVAPRLPK